MRVLLDANLLLRLDDEGHAHHDTALAALDWLAAHDHEAVIVPQVLYEYWVVATRPLEVNGLGLDVASAERAVAEWMTVFKPLLDERGVFGHWRDLVSAHEVKGKNAHDARLVAAMQRHRVTTLVTFNTPDFARFTGINVFSPADVLNGLLTT